MDTPTTRQVTEAITGIHAIGEARRALEAAGWCASIAGNRITVNGEVFAQLLPAIVGATGNLEPRWVVYTVTGDGDRSRP